MKRTKQSLFAQTTCVTLMILCSFFAQSALSFDALRPLSSQLQAQHPAAGTQSMFSGKSSAAGTLTYEGMSNAVPSTIIGKAALFSSYSAYDISRNIQYGDIKAERDIVLPQVIEEISKAIKRPAVSNTEEALRELNSYCGKVSNYFSER